MRMFPLSWFLPACLISAGIAAHAAPPAIRTVPARPGAPMEAHEAVPGRPVTLMAAADIAGPDVEATWDFGDSSLPHVFAPARSVDLSARHTYQGSAGAVYTAKLRVLNKRTGESAEAEYRVVLRERSIEAEASVAIEKALWYLHTTANRTAPGGWKGRCGAACDPLGAVTASNVLAFELAGYYASGAATHPYTETLKSGLRYLLENAGDRAVRTAEWARALDAANEPDRIAEAGPEGVAGRSFRYLIGQSSLKPGAAVRELRSAAVDLSIEDVRALLDAQTPEGYWESDSELPGFATARAVVALASKFRSAASTIFNVSSQVSVTVSAYSFNRSTRTYNATVTVLNTSATAITGPISVQLTNLPAGMTLTNADGSFTGGPYRTLPAVASLAPGSSASVGISITTTAPAAITWTPVTYSGVLPPTALSVGCPAATGTVGTPYSSALTGDGGVQVYSFGVGPGSLPPPLLLNPANGAITGTPNTTGPFVFQANITDGTGATANASCTITISSAATVAVTVTTVPAGLSIVVDGNTLTSPQTFNWTPGSNHTIATTTPQGSGGTRYVFNNWSDGGAISHSVNPSSATTFTASFDTEHQLTVAASPANGGTVTPASGQFFPAGSVQNVTATANSGFVFANWTGPVANSSAAATTVTMNAPQSVTANFSAQTGITVTTVPAGLSIIVDGNTLTSPQTFNWTPGSNHTIATTTPQGSGGTRYVFNNWSDGGAISHSVVAPGSATTYTATFDTQYQLTTAAAPANGGTVTPASGSFFPAGSVQNVSATANSGFSFTGWTGPVANVNSAATTVTMDAPKSITANFVANISVTVQTSPVGRSFTVDGTTYTTTQNFSWIPGSTHTIETTTPQDGPAGTRHVFLNWSDAGAISHSVSPSVSTTFTASFETQYQLNISASPANGGTFTPATGQYYTAGTVQNISATANANFRFNNWTGATVANANNASTTINMDGPKTLTANFIATISVTVQTSPAGRSFSVDGTGYTSAQTFTWDSGSNHTIATTSPQDVSGGTRYQFSTWSDGGAISHSVSPSVNTTYTANFDTLYQLTTAASPSNGGTVTPATGQYFAANSVQNVIASANANFAFNGWVGPVANAASAVTTVTMSGPVTITANFLGRPTAVAKNYSAQAHMSVAIGAGSGLLVGAAGSGSGTIPPLQVGTVSGSTPSGATITGNLFDGSFSFDPPANTTGNVTFTYTVCYTTVALCSTATNVTFSVAGPIIHFVNAASPTNGSGTMASPFNNLASAVTTIGANTGRGIFLYNGTYSTGINLNNSGVLIGQGVSTASSAGFTNFDAVFSITPPAGTAARPSIAGTRPTVQGTVSLNTNSVVRGLNLSTGANTALTSVASAGSVTVTEANLTTTTGTAATFSGTSGNITLGSINTNGAATPLVFANTNLNFTVLGDGQNRANGTGGSLQSVSNNALTATTVSGTIDLRSMNITMTTNAIYGALFDNNLGGTATANLTGCNFTGVTGSFTQNKSLLQFETGASANLTANVQNSFFNGSRTYGVAAIGVGSSTLNFTLNQSGFGTNGNTGAAVNQPGSSISNAPAIGALVSGSSSANVHYNITNNTFWGASGTAGAVYAVTISGASNTGSAQLNGFFTGNRIGLAGVTGSGCSGSCAALGLLPGNAGTFNATVSNNDIRQVNSVALNIVNTVGTASTSIIAHVTNNTFAEPDLTGSPAFQRAIVYAPGNSAGSTTSGCANITGNNISGGWQAGNFIRITTANTTGTFVIPGLSPSVGATTTQVNTYVSGLNGGAGVNTTISGPINGGASCPATP